MDTGGLWSNITISQGKQECAYEVVGNEWKYHTSDINFSCWYYQFNAPAPQ